MHVPANATPRGVRCWPALSSIRTMTVGFGIAPNLLTSPWSILDWGERSRAAAIARIHRRWGLSPRPENACPVTITRRLNGRANLPQLQGCRVHSCRSANEISSFADEWSCTWRSPQRPRAERSMALRAPSSVADPRATYWDTCQRMPLPGRRPLLGKREAEGTLDNRCASALHLKWTSL